MNKAGHKLVILQAVADALMGNSFPLKSGQDLSWELRRQGLAVSPQEVTGALIVLKKRNDVRRCVVYGGIRPFLKYYNWKGENIGIPRRTYWFLTARRNEVFPMSRKQWLEQKK